jgi:hypothetical protein
MRENEAAWVAAALRQSPAEPVLNLGSSSLAFRTSKKPHIERELFRPLLERGVRVIHADLREDEGVDISGDIFEPEVQRRLRAVQAGTLLCNNILEHVTDRAGFAALCETLVPSGAQIIVTVPHSYPYHADPIDPGYRPRPEQIAELFPRCRLIRAEVIEDGNGWQEIRRRGMVREALRLLVPFWHFKAWRYHLHNLLWLHRPYLISAVVLQRV